ncbi:rnd multidrug efflux transporter [hydrocarbon metagenome]|uniref:Rnd multidrug efflux transporter n=1 Tax=hydrocarbon metagenome TaxID=938273 RepID=A0A0W8E8K1_9ZZZZ
MFLSNLSLKRPVLATVSILALIILGINSFMGLNINDWPELEFPYIAVTIVQPGATPEQMESKVARKVEEAIGQISGVKHIYTEVHEGAAVTWAEFTLETKAQTAAQDVQDKLGSIRGQLPADIEEPVIVRYDPSMAPIVSLAVTGDVSILELSTLVDKVIKTQLETISGVGSVNVVGNEEREIHLNLDLDKLNAYGLTTAEVIESLSRENMDIPAGSMSSEERKVILRTTGQIKDLEGFGQLPAASRNGVQIYIKDIAQVEDGIKEKDSVARYQGHPVVGLDIVKQSGSNTVVIAERIKEAVDTINSQLPSGVKIEVVRDNSLYIRSSVNHVLSTLFEGSLLAILTVFLFLRNWRSTLIAALAIPTSIIATFFALRLMNFTLNTMSLMALSLSVGLLIDDAIVVIENIIRHLNMGKTPFEAAREGTSEIGLAVTATTFTVIAVFLPVGMMTGQVGQFFKQFGFTVVFAVLVSLLVSFTLVPLLASRYLDREEESSAGPIGRFLAWFNRGFDWFAEQYRRLLKAALLHRWRTLVAALAVFLGSLMVIPFMGSSFVPTSDLGECSMVVEFDAGLNLEAAGKVTEKVEEILNTYPEIIKTYATVNTEEAIVFIKMVDKTEREQTLTQVAAEIRQELRSIPGIRISMLFNTGIAEEKAWAFRLQGEDLDQMLLYAEQAQGILETIPGAVDVSCSYKPGKPEVKLEVKQDQAADLGVSTAYIATTMRTLLTGTVVGQYEQGAERFDVRLRLQDAQRQDVQDLARIYLPAGWGMTGAPSALIPLDQVTEPVFSTSASVIDRYDRSREIVLSGNLDGLSLGEFNEIFEQRVQEEMPLAEGYHLSAGGDAERMDDVFQSMGMAFVMGVLFIFLILAAQFESYIDPLSIMFALPLAIIGAILGLKVMGSDLSLVSLIGIIMLMGLVTKNAILLIDFTKQARARGVERSEAIQQAAATRLRPIMMTSTAMILGMVPVALALGIGAEQRAPMAHATIGGLITSTLLTLIVVPVIYTLLDDLINRTKSGRKQIDGSQ